MQTIVTDVHGVCLSGGSTVCGSFVQSLPNYFDSFLPLAVNSELRKLGILWNVVRHSAALLVWQSESISGTVLAGASPVNETDLPLCRCINTICSCCHKHLSRFVF